MASEKVKKSAEETNERAQFMVEEHGQAVFVHCEIEDQAVQTSPGIGKRVPIHAISPGKAILAELPDERVEEIIGQKGLPAITEHTKTNRESLFEELERTRK